MDIILAIDGNSLVNRTFYALPPMQSADGTPTQAVFGFVKLLIGLIDKYNPTHMVVAFDLPHPTFRHLKYSDYKGTRKGMPEELAVQMPILKQLLQNMNIKIIDKKGYEADDILGTVARMFRDIHTYIVTGDGDSLQLIDDSTTVLITKKGISELTTFTEQTLLEEKGLRPEQIIDYKALCGDNSDNIPGVKGIGDKSAISLITKYDSLNGVYSNIDNITGSNNNKLRDKKDLAYLSYELATIDTKVPLEITKEECCLRYPFNIGVRNEFEKLGFKSFLNNTKLFDHNVTFANDNVEYTKTQKECEIVVIDTSCELIRVIDNLSINDIGIHVDIGKAVHISDGAKEFVIKLKSDLISEGLELEECFDIINKILINPDINKVCYDAKNLLNICKKHNTTLINYYDVRLANYLLDYSLAQKEINKYVEFVSYNDKCMAFCLVNTMSIQLQKLKENEQYSLYFDIELPLVEVLYNMEHEGMRIDTEFLRVLSSEYTARLDKIALDIYEIAGFRFNINSPKQLSKVLFEDMQLSYPNKKDKTLSTGVDILTQVQDTTGIINKILKFRELSKLNSTYVDGLLRMTQDGIVHSEFRQMQVITGRLSSVEPNLQNIPIRTEEGQRIRKAFVSREGKTLISADYSQIELRLLAHLSEDTNMIAAFNNYEDIHTSTAAEVFGVDKDKVTSEQRYAAKAVNFGIIYGISEYSLSQDLNIFPSQAKAYIKTYFEKYPNIKSYIDSVVEIASKTGKINTMYNRVRVINEIKSAKRSIRLFGERAAMNMPMQGSASDIVKIAMNSVYKAIRNTSAKIILQVHDELIVECDDGEVDNVVQIVKDCMQSAAKLSVPLIVDISKSKVWG